MLEPVRGATMLLPGEQILAAGIFGVQDQAVAAGLLGVYAVQGSLGALVGASGRRGQTHELASAGGQLAVSIMVAVSPAWIHICRWDERESATAEVARFQRSTAAVGVERYRSACRISLTDQETGYRLVLTGTQSRLHRYGPGVRAVVRSLSGS